MRAHYKITVVDGDYYCTRYITWVEADSKIKAIAKAAALAGQRKLQDEFEHQGPNAVWPHGLTEPTVEIQPCEPDEYWERREEVVMENGPTWAGPATYGSAAEQKGSGS